MSKILTELLLEAQQVSLEKIKLFKYSQSNNTWVASKNGYYLKIIKEDNIYKTTLRRRHIYIINELIKKEWQETTYQEDIDKILKKITPILARHNLEIEKVKI